MRLFRPVMETSTVFDRLLTVYFAGQWSDMVVSTIDLGISILMGGNTDVQKVSLLESLHQILGICLQRFFIKLAKSEYTVELLRPRRTDSILGKTSF
jgi:hypothetical protein